jgi:hypothetical protein
MNDPLSRYMFIRKDVVFQVVTDLHDPCIGTDMSIWILRVGVHGVPRDTYNPWRAPNKYGHWNHQLGDAGLTPFTRFSRLGCRSL